MPQTTTQPDFATLLQSAITDPGTVSAAYRAFHGYSLGNQILAMVQCAAREIPIGPIASFMGWKDKGRYVRKGEKAIVLCMPITMKRTVETEDGNEDVTFARFVYRANWFALSQTEGDVVAPEPLPDWSAELALTALQITEVPFEMTDGNCQGYARARTIAVSPIAEHPHKTRFHEIAHVLLGHTTEHEQADSPLTPRTLREVEAESVAMLCGAALGLPGVEQSRGYIQVWNHSGQPIPEESARRIMKTADTILKAGRPS